VPEGLRYPYVPNIMAVYAKLGSKRGGERSLHMLPQRFELGEGWKQHSELTWRTGRMGRAHEWGIRARKVKSVTAVRHFEQESASRWLTTQVIPAATESDAALFLDDLPNRFLRNPRTIVKLTNEHAVSGIVALGGPSTWAHEQQTTSKMGPGVIRYLSGTVGPVLYLVMASGFGDRWPWVEVTSVAELIVERISRVTD
jgi:hypothetical protein